MQMTESEIVRSYKEAAEPARQIRILAQLNCCSQDDIARIVGLQEVPKLRRGRKATKATVKVIANPEVKLHSAKDEVLTELYRKLDMLDAEIKEMETRYKETTTAIKVLSEMEDTNGN